MRFAQYLGLHKIIFSKRQLALGCLLVEKCKFEKIVEFLKALCPLTSFWLSPMITMDFNAETRALVISWIGKDEDGDTLTYDVFVKENDEIIIDDKDLTIVALSPIIAVAGATYVVQVTSKDSFGNLAVSTQTLKITD